MYEGKQLKRVKTSVRSSELNPVYNESFSFDVPLTELDKVYFSLAICHFIAEKKSTKLIGRVYLGMNFDAFARDHWTSMMNNPRKKIVATYKITNWLWLGVFSWVIHHALVIVAMFMLSVSLRMFPSSYHTYWVRNICCSNSFYWLLCVSFIDLVGVYLNNVNNLYNWNKTIIDIVTILFYLLTKMSHYWIMIEKII